MSFANIFTNQKLAAERAGQKAKYLNALSSARDPQYVAKTIAAARFDRIGHVLVNALIPTQLTVPLTVDQLRGEVRNALIRDSRFRTQNQMTGQPDTNCYVSDIILPVEESNEWTAVLCKEGLTYKIGFTINDASQAVLSVLPPVETRVVYNAGEAGDSLLNADPRDPGAATRESADGGVESADVNAEVTEAADLGAAGDANAPTRKAADQGDVAGQSAHDDSEEEKKKKAAEVAFNDGTVGDKTPNTNSTSK